MKNIFKSLMIVVLFVGLGSSAFAQTGTTTGTVTASATVAADLTVTKSADVAFGTVTQGENASITVITEGAHSNCSIGTPGILKVTSTSGSSLLATCDASINLKNGVNEMAFAPTIAHSADIAAFGSALVASSFTSDGEDYLIIGGTLTVGGTQVVGSYSGTLTVSVSYN